MTSTDFAIELLALGPYFKTFAVLHYRHRVSEDLCSKWNGMAVFKLLLFPSRLAIGRHLRDRSPAAFYSPFLPKTFRFWANPG